MATTSDPVYNPPLTGGGSGPIAGFSILGVSGAGPATPAAITPSVANTVLSYNGTTTDFRKVTGTMMGGFGNTSLIVGNASGELANAPGFTVTAGALQFVFATSNLSATFSVQASNALSRVIAQATSGATRQIAIEAWGPAAGGTSFGRARASMVAVTDLSSGTAPSVMAFGSIVGATPLVFGTQDVERVSIDASGNVAMGTAALATTATDGFFYDQTCAGIPTGVPTTKAGRSVTIYDSTNRDNYRYDFGTAAWILETNLP